MKKKHKSSIVGIIVVIILLLLLVVFYPFSTAEMEEEEVCCEIIPVVLNPVPTYEWMDADMCPPSGDIVGAKFEVTDDEILCSDMIPKVVCCEFTPSDSNGKINYELVNGNDCSLYTGFPNTTSKAIDCSYCKFLIVPKTKEDCDRRSGIWRETGEIPGEEAFCGVPGEGLKCISPTVY